MRRQQIFGAAFLENEEVNWSSSQHEILKHAFCPIFPISTLDEKTSTFREYYCTMNYSKAIKSDEKSTIYTEEGATSCISKTKSLASPWEIMVQIMKFGRLRKRRIDFIQRHLSGNHLVNETTKFRLYVQKTLNINFIVTIISSTLLNNCHQSFCHQIVQILMS